MTDNTSSALILMSTFNGEKFLAKQIESIIFQDFANWTLMIRDDGSKDATIAIIKKYCELEPRIIFIEDNSGNLNAAKSFSALMQQALTRHEDFIFFCDQDDIWLPNKISRQIDMLQHLQQKHGTDTPILVHTDLCVVDSNLKVIHRSYLDYEKLKRNTRSPLKTLLINNFITGCTIGMNKALLNLASPVPDNAFMHDWWCALCAAATGKIGFIDGATLLYRQHNNNSIGSKGFYGKFGELRNVKATFTKRRKNLKMCFSQASSLLTRINERNVNYQVIRNFVGLANRNFFSRYFKATGLKLKPASVIRSMVFWVMLGFA